MESLNGAVLCGVNWVGETCLEFPPEMFKEIFSFLNPNLRESQSLGEVCKAWKQIIDVSAFPELKIFLKEIQGNSEFNYVDSRDWLNFFGEEALCQADKQNTLASLPIKYLKFLTQTCPVDPEKKAWQSFAPVWIPEQLNQKELDPQTLGEFAKGYFPNTTNGYRGKVPASDEKGEGRWVLMMKNFLPESCFKFFEEQKALVDGMADDNSVYHYELPTPFVALISLLGQYLKADKSHPHWIKTRFICCAANSEGDLAAVGCISENGPMWIPRTLTMRSPDLGVLAQLKL